MRVSMHTHDSLGARLGSGPHPASAFKSRTEGPGLRAQGPGSAKARRRLLPALILAALAQTAIAPVALAADAQVDVYAFDETGAISDLAVQLNDGPRIAQDEFGALTLRLPAGEHRLRVYRGDTLLSEIPVTTVEDEIAQIIVNLPRRGDPQIAFESSAGGTLGTLADDTPSGPPGLLEGQIISVEDGQPIRGARIFVSGTPIDIQTDAEGRYRIELPPGDYSLSVLAASFNAQTITDVQIASEQTATRAIELTPAGLELPDFVVLEPFVEGSLAAFVEEKRTSAAVTDVLGAEQISRAGDSDAAGALKRVTGLTLVDGKFIYVRGLGERYSSTLINGAQVPSPDPTRRVVPLDLFPTEILSGIVVQKTYGVDMPGEFGGGTVQLRTRGVPESFLLRASGTIGYVDGATGEDGALYRGGSRDWTGRDDGARAAPPGLLSFDPSQTLPPQELADLGRALAAKGYDTRTKKLAPNSSLALAIGDDFHFSDGLWSVGYIAGVRHSQSWDTQTEERTFFAATNAGLAPNEFFERTQTERAVDNSLFGSAGFTYGEHHQVNVNLIQLRQTTDEVQTDEGVLGSGNFERQTTLEWIENELQLGQLNGKHSIPALGNFIVDWQYSTAKASREAPNVRVQRFAFNETTGEFRVETFGNEQRFESLQDDADEYKLDLLWEKEFNEGFGARFGAGASVLRRERDSSIRRFRFVGGSRIISDSLEDVYNDATIGPGPGQFRLQDRSQPTDSYTASVDLDAFYLSTDAYWNDFRLYLGARQEEIFQEVVTLQPFVVNPTPQIGVVDERSLLPAGTLTWAYSDKAQVRLAYGESLSRPDIREQSRANFIDPLLDIRVEGNPDLKQTEIRNLDARWEYYFSATESLSVAYFQKTFDSPIELVESPASGQLLRVLNAESATNSGIEIDYYRSMAGLESLRFMPTFGRNLPWQDVFIGLNYARIESEIDLGANPGIVTNASRPLQGQSPYVANLSVSYLPADGDIEATLLYNVSGERISQVGVSGRPDTYEQPFNQVDFTFSAKLPWGEGWKAKLRLRNLLDPAAEFKIGNEVARTFNKGREVAFSIEWRM